MKDSKEYNQARERNIELMLEERIGKRAAPDLRSHIVRLAREEAAHTVSSPVANDDLADSRRHRLAIAAAAACVVIGLGLIVADRWIGDRGESGEQYSDSLLGTKKQAGFDEILILEHSLDPLSFGANRIENVIGRVLIGRNGVPDGQSLDVTADYARHNGELNDKEIAMMLNRKNWKVRNGVALCLLSGGMLFNGEMLLAQDAGDETATDEAASSVDALKAFEEAVLKAEEECQRRQQEFDDLDTNKDGSLDSGEYAESETADYNNDGSVSLDEFLMKSSADAFDTVWDDVGEATQEAAQPNPEQEFDELDLNRDGELDGDEYDILKLKKKDANIDGVVSRDEWDADKVEHTARHSRIHEVEVEPAEIKPRKLERPAAQDDESDQTDEGNTRKPRAKALKPRALAPERIRPGNGK